MPNLHTGRKSLAVKVTEPVIRLLDFYTATLNKVKQAGAGEHGKGPEVKFFQGYFKYAKS